MKNENYQLQAHSASHKENIVVEVTKAIEKERVVTTKKVASITTEANKISGRLSDARNRNLVMSNTNKNKRVNPKENSKLNLTV